MHPKTYQVHVRRPFGLLTRHAYIFHLHEESALAALLWVSRVFKGVDIEPTLRSWAAPKRDIPRVGNTDPVYILDCDSFRSRQRIGGKLVAKDTPPGHFRRSSEEVSTDLLKLFNLLQDERSRLTESFEPLKHCYERGGPEWYRERLVQIKAAVENALRWQANVWVEYLPTQQGHELVLPQQAALAA